MNRPLPRATGVSLSDELESVTLVDAENNVLGSCGKMARPPGAIAGRCDRRTMEANTDEGKDMEGVDGYPVNGAMISL